MGDKPKMTDEQFTKRLGELAGNKSALGRELQISSTAVAKRWKKILGQEGADRGVVAAVVKKVSGSHGDKSKFKGELVDSEKRATHELNVLEMLVSSHNIQQRILQEIQKNIEANGKIKPFERDEMLKISEKQAALAKIYLDCHATVYNAKTNDLFIRTVLGILQEESHELHRKVLRRFRDAEPIFNSILGFTPSDG
ncbi:hypothetical protein KAR91_37025 [Candidatus Pacearchaeota archaeon]|nr:hypothetical protein [Candidatus Pacearchaeota archaeon]